MRDRARHGELGHLALRLRRGARPREPRGVRGRARLAVARRRAHRGGVTRGEKRARGGRDRRAVRIREFLLL